MLDDATGRTIVAREPRRIPWLDIVFGFGPMVPIAVGAAAAWWLQGQPLDYLVILVTLLYSASILCFLAGANSIFSGEKLLTTPNPDFDADQQMFALLGLKPRQSFKNHVPEGATVLAAL